jgi:hypothetical protein
MKLILKGGLLILLFIFARTAFGQDALRDSTRSGIDSMQTEEVNVVDIIIQRGLMVGNGDTTNSTPIKNTSGTWFVGLGFKIPVIKNKAGFRLTPGLAFTKLNYDSVNVGKEFPGLIDSTESKDYFFQKHRLAYFQVPLGVYVNFTTDEKGRPQIFGEAGGYIGYRIGGVLRYGENKVRIDADGEAQDQQVRTKITNIPDMEPLQYGFYGRLGYKNVAFNVNYRVPRLFKEPRTNDLGELDGTNPLFPRLELGVTLLL